MRVRVRVWVRMRVRFRVSALTQRLRGGDEQLAQPACRAWLARPHRVPLREDVVQQALEHLVPGQGEGSGVRLG